ncbi:MAG: hypothetical protein KF680_04635 [Cryobacterium sp.]|nr:hypothetical protein [Cryobacterium sp.]
MSEAPVSEMQGPQKATAPRSRVESWPAILRIPWLMLSEFVDHVLLEPHREGRLRAKDWPVGVVSIVVIAVIAYIVAVALILFSAPLRAALPLYVSAGGVSFSFPRALLWIFLVLLVLSVSLLQTAAMHVATWLCVLVTALTVLITLFVGVTDAELGAFSSGRLATIAASILLVVFVIVRRRSSFAWWEFAVVFGLLGLSLAFSIARAAVTASPGGVDLGPITLSVVMFTIGQLAIPSAIAAGSAVAELATSSALRAVGVVRRHLPVAALVVGLVALLSWRAWVVVETVRAGESVAPLQLGSSVALSALIVGAWLLLARLRGSRVASPPSATELTDKLSGVAQPIGAGLAITFGPFVAAMLLLQVLFGYLGQADWLTTASGAIGLLSHSVTIGVTRLAVGVLLLVLAIRWAQRQRRVVPELLASIGVVVVTLSAASLFGPVRWLWTSESLSIVATIVCTGLLVWFLVARTLTVNRMAGLAVALLLTALFQQRDFVSDPLGAVLGFTGVAFVLFGYVWAFLTSGSYANEGSKRYPKPARILLFLASTLFGVTVLAYTALARNPDSAINLGAFADVGDQIFGTAIVVGALVAMLRGVLSDREPELDTAGKETDSAATTS